MSIFLVTILAISANPSDTSQATVAPAAQVTAAPRSGRELSEAAHAALRHWAKVSDQQAEAAARDLLGIYREILQDKRMARSQLETLRVTVRARLDQLCTQISKQIAKDQAAAKSNSPANSTVKTVAAGNNPPGGAALAQMGLPAGGGAGMGVGGANGQNAHPDNGPELVDLIQTVISPKSWDANGGPCTISYWQQQHAIVVRATDDVHGQISDALEQLNRAGH